MIASRYINRSVIAVFATTLTVILLIAVGERFTHFLEKAALGQIPSTTLLTVVALRLPEILQMVVPFALYFSLLLSLGRLYSSQEMVVLSNSGAAPTQALRWLMPLIVSLAVAVGAMSIVLTPLARQMLEAHLEESSQNIGFAVFRPGIFHSQRPCGSWLLVYRFSLGVCSAPLSVVRHLCRPSGWARAQYSGQSLFVRCGVCVLAGLWLCIGAGALL